MSPTSISCTRAPTAASVPVPPYPTIAVAPQVLKASRFGPREVASASNGLPKAQLHYSSGESHDAAMVTGQLGATARDKQSRMCKVSHLMRPRCMARHLAISLFCASVAGCRFGDQHDAHPPRERNSCARILCPDWRLLADTRIGTARCRRLPLHDRVYSRKNFRNTGAGHASSTPNSPDGSIAADKSARTRR